MKLLRFLLTVLVLFSAAASSHADCPDGELRFSFENLPLRTAFMLIADYGGVQARFQDAVSKVVPVNFPCTPWREAARNLAQRHGLSVEVNNGAMYVSK